MSTQVTVTDKTDELIVKVAEAVSKDLSLTSVISKTKILEMAINKLAKEWEVKE